MTSRFADSVTLSEKDLQATLEKSMTEVAQFASVIQLNLKQTPFGRQLRSLSGSKLQEAEASAEKAAAAAAAGGDVPVDTAGALASSALVEAPVMASLEGTSSGIRQPANVEAIPRRRHPGHQQLAGGGFLAQRHAAHHSGDDVPRQGLPAGDPVHQERQGEHHAGPLRFRAGCGGNRQGVQLSRCRFTPDIFHAAISKGVDLLISDINDPKISSRVPEWYRKSVNAGTFVLFPMNIKNNPVALIYADMEEAGAIVIPEKELSLFRTLRNQAVLAIKQSM